MDDDFGVFGPALRQMRLEAGLTIAELAQASGVSARAISDMERGRTRAPHRRTVVALAGVLPVSDAQPVTLIGDTLPAVTGPDPAFRGRTADLDWLRRLAQAATAKHAAPVAVICGMAGSGKTALAIQAAHELREAFPNGIVLAGLRSTSSAPTERVDVLPTLLRATGQPAGEVPADLADRAALYRARLAERPLLVILDDAANEEQVRPLLPPNGPSFTVVTSRRLLTGLDGVHRRHLAALPPDDGRRALSAMLASNGPAQPSDGEITEAARYCDGLPLALRVAANRLAGLSGSAVRTVLAGLADGSELVTNGPLAQALAVSYERLSPAAARMYRRLPLRPNTTIELRTAAQCADVDRPEAEDILDELVESTFLQLVDGGHYRLPRLLRLFSAQTRRTGRGHGRGACHWVGTADS